MIKSTIIKINNVCKSFCWASTLYNIFLFSVFTIFTVTIIVNNKTEKEIAFYIGNSLIIYVWNQCFTFIGKLSASVPLLIIIYKKYLLYVRGKLQHTIVCLIARGSPTCSSFGLRQADKFNGDSSITACWHRGKGVSSVPKPVGSSKCM